MTDPEPIATVRFYRDADGALSVSLAFADNGPVLAMGGPFRTYGATLDFAWRALTRWARCKPKGGTTK